MSSASVDGKTCAAKCAKLTWKQRIKITIGIVVPIVTMILAIVAFNKWHSAVEDFKKILGNWNIPPITDIQFAASSSGCPTGYIVPTNADPVNYQMPFYYTTTDCDCSKKSSNCTDISSTNYVACNTRQRTCGCSTTTTVRVEVITKWAGDLPFVCVKRAPYSENALNRKRAKVAGDCSSYAGTRACGNWDCIPTGEPCLITAFSSVAAADVAGLSAWQGVTSPNLTSAVNGTVSDSDLANLGSDQVIVFNRTTLSLDPMAILPEIELRIGPGPSPVLGDSAVLDARWNAFSTITMDQMLEANINNYISYFAGMGVSQSVWAGKTWQMATRGEIKWNIDCPYTRNDVQSLQDEINITDTALLWSLIISSAMAFYNFICGIHDFNELTDDDPTNDGAIHKKKAVCNMITESANLIPTIISLLMAQRIFKIFISIRDAQCSDSISNGPFQTLAPILKDMGTINIIKTIASTLFLIYRIVTWLREKYCPPDDKKKKGGEGTEMTKSDIALAPEYNGPN